MLSDLSHDQNVNDDGQNMSGNKQNATLNDQKRGVK